MSYHRLRSTLPAHPESSAVASSEDLAEQLREQTLTGAAWQLLASPEPVHEEVPRRVPDIWPAIERLIDQHLTERQRQVVELYDLRGLDQVSVAALLGITQQSVNEHLSGKRGGTRGGRIPKLRKQCAHAYTAPRRGGRVPDVGSSHDS